MDDELGEDGKRKYTVAEIAAAYGVTRPTIYRYLSATGAQVAARTRPVRSSVES